MKTDERKLFDRVSSIGEILEGELHIIDTTDRPSVEGEQRFRVYHKSGYCFDVIKECVDEKDNGKLIYDYSMLSEWDGFKKINAKAALNIIKVK